MPLEVLNFVFYHFYAFRLQSFLHGGGWREMVLAGKEPYSVHHTMGRYLLVAMCCVHGPTHHARTHAGAQVGGNGSVRRYATFGNQLHDLEDIIEERVLPGSASRYFFCHM